MAVCDWHSVRYVDAVRLGIVLAMVGLAVAPASPAHGQNRSFCTDRIDADAPLCALATGEAMVETTAFSHDRSADPTNLNHTLALADTLLRVGLDEATEVQLGLTGLVHAVTRTRDGRLRETATGIGDSYVALRRAIEGFGAIEAFVTLPTGRGVAGAGTWGAGIALPVDLPAPDGFQLYAVPQIEALPDASGEARHLAYGGALGMARDIGRAFVGTLELHFTHDLDPAGRGVNALLAAALNWQLSPKVQIHGAANIGTAHDARRATLLLGIALRP